MLQAKIHALSNSSHALPSAVDRSIQALGYVRRFLLNPRIRSENLTRIFYLDAHFQGATYSEPNRYPELFAACASSLNQTCTPAILSFGCSTGEEVSSLAEHVPNAMIVGVDINRWCLRHARKAFRGPRIRFFHTRSSKTAALANLDAIFAMAVFQRSQNRNHTEPFAHRGFRFAAFEEQIAHLDAKLKPGGLFFIDHADFRFEDTATAAHYAPFACEGSQFSHNRPLFGRDNHLIATRYTMQRAFQKRTL